jgi:hypothetical protein
VDGGAADRRRAGIVVLAIAATVAVGRVAWWALLALDPRGPWFALVVVWAPMTALGTMSHVVPIHLPERFHRLRRFEIDGRVYEWLGIRTVKRLLRRGPVTWFNPRLRMPEHRDAASLARLDGAMRSAEASHAVLFVAVLPVVVNALARGWWAAAAWTLGFDLVLNGYPVMLQRYNRALLSRPPAARSTSSARRRPLPP